uniref:Cilia- and flagella-associated protein 57 n=1 Tax=Percolomonas cosmopolitus TaxID=63605 RepID=A0A7S1KL60_9EUKA|mmetsp:Transcript_10646/g.39739  ORF Transcript_10646/g.39739 Transcript_10646/m.39739 type:complete len:1214 (+) Transcript_10646:305-3946(+)|eukprot:CAMPEP_0117447260 /NCGR_PEP_ID=MMETSP0759-20121206/6778_1 /TAXON_ID=63605 /ORGANISM="Percolomonas cosmopolitus, Strain WS" /LENGTH=1213 /DNA_ID=CAMNT_0005239579 /DNA_START=283 /DNA_END=3924 /DNA_ORIENTATION=-
MSFINEYIRTQQNILTIRSAYGTPSGIPAAKVAIIQSQPLTFLYITGQSLVLQSPKQTRYITGSGKGISTFAVAPNRRHVAVALKGKDPMIEIYELTGELKRRKQYLFPGLGSMEYADLKFSDDGEYLIAQGDSPDYTLVLWKNNSIGSQDSSNKPHLLASQAEDGGMKFDHVGHIASSNKEKNPVYQCSISPNNETLCVTGNGIFKLFKFIDGIIKPVQIGLGNREPEPYFAHCWVTEDRLILTNDHGDLFVVEGEDYKLLPCSPSDGIPIRSMIRTPQGGFICAGDNGYVTVFDPIPNDEDEMFQKRQRIQVENVNSLYNEEDLSVRHMTFDEQTEVLGIITKSGILMYTSLASSGEYGAEASSDNAKFSFLTPLFHSNHITGLDTCVRKPYVATCSLDQTVRILNYQKSSMVVCQKFSSEAHSIALHPSGLYCAVGFSDKLRFLKILGSKLVEEKFFAIRKCQEVKFSHGGHFFAAVNGTVINVYHTYTLQPVYALRGHTSRVRSIYWKPEDTHIASVGMDGNIFEFQLKNEKKVNDNQIKHCQFTGVATDGKSIFTTGNDATLRQFQDSIAQNEFPTGEHSMISLELGNLQKYLYGGMDDGSVRVYHLSSLDEFEEQIMVHEKPVMKVVLTYHENLLMTISQESLFIFEINQEGHKAADVRFSEEILISTQDLQEKNDQIKKLEQMFSELKSDNDYEERKKEIEFNERVKEQAGNFQLEMKQKIQTLYNLQTDKANIKREKESELKENELGHKKDIQEMEHSYNQRIASAMNQIKEVNGQREAGRRNLEETRAMRARQHEQDINQLQNDTNDEIRQKQEEINRLEEEKAMEADRHVEMMRQTHADHQILVDKFMKKYQAKLDMQKNANLRLSGSNTIDENKEKEYEKEISKLESFIKDLDSKLADYKVKLDQKIKEKKAVMKENKDREDKIVEKEKRIFELKKQNQELEKYKFVLDYTITTLNEQIKPSKDKKASLVKEINEIDSKLKDYMVNNTKLKTMISDMKNTIQEYRHKTKDMRKNVRDADIYQARMKSHIHEVIEYIQSPKDLRERVKEFYQTHVNKKIQKADIDFDIQKEYDRQRMHLETSVDTMKNKLHKVTQKAKSENMRIMHENVVLINEINQLRRESRILKSRLREKEDRLGGGKDGRPHSAYSIASNGEEEDMELQLRREIDMQLTEINALQMKLEDLESEARSRSRPVSRELPPLK